MGHHQRRRRNQPGVSHPHHERRREDNWKRSKKEDQQRQLEEAIQQAMEDSTTTIRVDSHKRFSNISDELREVIGVKNIARRRTTRTRNTEDQRETNRLNEEVKTQLKQHRSKDWENRLEELDSDTPGLWKLAKILRQDKR